MAERLSAPQSQHGRLLHNVRSRKLYTDQVSLPLLPIVCVQLRGVWSVWALRFLCYDTKRCESGQYTPEELHQFREEPLLAPPASIRLDLSHQLCSPAFLRRLARWSACNPPAPLLCLIGQMVPVRVNASVRKSVNAWRYQLRLAQAYDLALELGSVAPGDVEQVLPHILRGQGLPIQHAHDDRDCGTD